MDILTQPKRRENENFVFFLSRVVLYRTFVLRFIIDYEKRTMLSLVYKIFMFVFLIQFIQYVNYEPRNRNSVNLPYTTITNICYYSNFEKNFDVSANGFLIYILTGYMALYMVGAVAVAAIVTKISKRTDFSKYLFYQYNKISMIVKSFVYLMYVNFYCASIIFTKFFISFHFEPKGNFKASLRAYGAFYWVFVILLHVMVAFHLAEMVFEFILHIHSMKKKNNLSRRSQFEFLLLFAMRIGMIIYQMVDTDSRMNKGYTVIVFLVLTLMLVTSFFKPVYYNFELQQVFRRVLAFVWIASLMNLAHVCFAMYELVVFGCFIYLFFFTFDKILFEFFITGRLIRQYQAFMSDKFQRDKIRADHFTRFFSLFFYMFINSKYFKNNRWLPQYVFEVHVQNCQEPNCGCRVETSKSSKALFQNLVNLFFHRYKIYFEQNKCNTLAFIKLNIINDLRENFFASYLFVVNLWTKTTSSSNRINLFNVIVEVDFILKKLDKKFTEESGLDSQKLPRLYEKITTLKKDMVQTAQKCKTLWTEVLESNPDMLKLSNHVEDIILKMNHIERKFKEIYKKSKNNYANLYNYSIFMINVFNYDEGAKKLIDQLSFIKKNIDSVDEKLAIISQKFAENSNSMILFASGNLNQLTNITNVYFNYKEFLGFEKNELIDHKVTAIIPDRIAVYHDQFVLKFFETSKGTFFNKNRIVPCINKDGYVVPGEVLLRIMPNIQSGIQFVLYFTNEMFILKNSFLKPELFTLGYSNYILFDDKKKVLGINERLAKSTLVSQNLVKSIVQKNHLTNCYITDLFPELDKNPDIAEKFFAGETVMIHLSNFMDDEKQLRTKNSNMTHTDDSTSKIMKNAWDEKRTVYAKLAFAETYGKGQVSISMMYFFEAQYIQNSGKEDNDNETKTIGEIKTSKSIKKQTTVDEAKGDEGAKGDKGAKGDEGAKGLSNKAIKEIQGSFLKKYAPKTDPIIKLLILLLFATNLVMFVYKFVDERMTTFEFFATYPKNSMVFGRQVIILNKIMQHTNLLGVFLANPKYQNISSIVNGIESNLKNIESYYSDLNLQTTELNLLYENPLNPNTNAKDLQGVYHNVTVIYPNVEFKDETLYNASLSTMITEISSLVYYIYNSDIMSLKSTNETAEAKAMRLKLLGYFAFIRQNIFYHIDMKLERLMQIRMDVIDDICDYISMKGFAFFSAKLVFVILLIIVIIVLIVKYHNSSFVVMSIFTKIDKNKCLDNIQRCENFIEIMDYLDKHNINKIELSHQLQENLFVSKEKFELKNKAILKTKEEGDHLSMASDLERPKLIRKRRLCGVNKDVIKIASILFVVPIMVIANLIFFVNYNIPIKGTLQDVEYLRFHSSVNMINYVLSREALLDNFNSTERPMISDWEKNVVNNAKTLPQIFVNNNNSPFKSAISGIVNTFNSDICLFWSTYATEHPACSDPKYREILTKGLSTVFVYTDNQITLMAESTNSGSNASFLLDKKNELDFLEKLNAIMLETLGQSTNAYLQQLNSSYNSIIVSYLVLLAFEIVVMVIFVTVFLVMHSRYFYFKKLFFEKVFILVSLRTIAENKSLLSFLKAKVHKNEDN
jgi:hypothetical protein